MNFLFENWRKHLNEDSKTKYFGPDPESLQCIKDFRNPMAVPPVTKDSFSACMVDSGWNVLGHGSFRSAFTIPGTDEVIFKTVNPRLVQGGDRLVNNAKNMNKLEAQSKFQTASDLAVRVYDAAGDFLWIKSEKVTRIKNWPEMLGFFPKLSETMKNMNFEKIFPKLLRRDPYKELAGIYRDPLLIEIIDLLQRSGAPTWDIRPGNVGYVTRDGGEQFVILDPGFGLPSDDLNDAMRRGEVPIPQELMGPEQDLVDDRAVTQTFVRRPGASVGPTKVERPRGKNISTRPINEGAILDFARKHGLPIAAAASILTANPGCAHNPELCDAPFSYQSENPRQEMIKLMRKHNISTFLLDGTYQRDTFIPSPGMIKKYPNLNGGVDVSGTSWRDQGMRELIVLRQAIRESIRG